MEGIYVVSNIGYKVQPIWPISSLNNNKKKEEKKKESKKEIPTKKGFDIRV